MKNRTHTLSCAVLAAAALMSACSRGSNEAAAVAAAQADLDKHDYKSAAIRAKSALQQNAKNSGARLLLGQALLESGAAVEAEVELRKAIELGAPESKALPLLAKAMLAQAEWRPLVIAFAATHLDDAASSADLKTSLAAAYAQLGERENALQATVDALKEWPQHIPATLLQARLVAAGGDVAGALALLEPVLAQSPKDAKTLVLKGELLRYGQHDRDAALAAFRAAAVADPTLLAAHAAIIPLLLEMRDVPGAKAQLEQLKTQYPKHPETLYFEAQLAFIGNDFLKTRELTESLLKRFPGDARVLQLAGAAEFRLNSLAKAESYLGQALKAAPAAVVPRQLLAQIFSRNGQPAKALEVLQPILQSQSPDVGSLTLAGQAYLQNGDLARSEAAFARAAKLDPKATEARTALALNQLAKGQIDSGFAALEAVAASDSGGHADLALIAARLRGKDLAGALKAIDALEKKQPDKAMVQVLRGNVQMQRKDTAAAVASYEKALALDPLYFPATAGLAAVELGAGRPEGARKRFEDLLHADPKNYRAMLGLAELKARGGGSKDEVTQAITDAVKASPIEQQPRLLLINYLLSQQDPKNALAAAQDAVAAIPGSLELQERLGTAQLAAGQAQQAVSTFTMLTASLPDRPGPELRLAEALVATKELGAAHRSLERALKNAPGLIPAQRALAEVAVMQKQPAEAIEIARGMQRAQPKQAAGYLLEADVQMQVGHPELAIPALRAALPLAATSATAVRLHRALEAAQRHDESERLAVSWLHDHPQDVAFQFYLGDLALARHDWPGAEARYRKVVEIQPDNALALNNIAWLLTKLQKPGATAMAERANQLLPGRPALMDTLAAALAADNQTQRAIDLQQKAIARAPEEASLKLTLAKIYLKAGDRPNARTQLENLAKLGDKFSAQGEVVELLKSL